nr:fused response regulator/phosphatase [Desulfobulbaceae bacterium]
MVEREMTILVIEDELFSRDLLVNILEGFGYRVQSAICGETGREIAGNEPPDLILLDIIMPGEDGFETCGKLKAHSATRDIPIIFISGNNDIQSKVKGLSIGGWDYITKPFQPDEVNARVRNCLKLRFAYQQIIREQAMRLQQMHEAQQAILVNPAEIPEANFAVYYLPVLEAGGDFYDVFRIAKGIHGYLVADISGHDLSASFATSALKALVRQNASILYAPNETVHVINQILTSIFQEGQHLTAIYAALNRVHNVLAVVNAGHLPMLFMPQQGEPYWVEANSDILGIFADAFFETRTLSVSAGDRFYLFSDGLVESFIEPQRTRTQGMDGFRQAAILSRQQTITEATATIIKTFSPAGHTFDDDVLLLGVDI